jgi:hypothetical protein
MPRKLNDFYYALHYSMRPSNAGVALTDAHGPPEAASAHAANSSIAMLAVRVQ